MSKEKTTNRTGRNQKINLDELNDEQRAAVTHQKGPLLLIAGAGTGKTTVITQRILWLITEQGIRPDNILALTFTEKAASEMEERVDRLLPMGQSSVRINTFHGYCEGLLRDYAIEIGLDPAFKILTAPEQWLILQKHLYELPLKHFRPHGNPTKFLQAIVRAIGAAKDQDLGPERFLAYARLLEDSSIDEKDEEAKKSLTEESERWREFAGVYSAYQNIILRESAMDFGDIILNAVALLKDRPSVAQMIRRNLSEVLVDEFQDTNGAQNILLRLLVPNKDGQITVVGDDDQSIYAWRGSNIINILSFQEWYPNAKKVVLTQNYRSPQGLLDAAYRLIQFNNPYRLEKTAKVDKKLKSAVSISEKPAVSYHQFSTPDEEYEFIANQIAYGVEKLNRNYSDYSILLRANSQAELITPALMRRGIFFHVADARGLLLRPEIRDLTAYLQAVNNPLDDRSVFRIVSHKSFDFAPFERQRALFESRQKNNSFRETLKEAVNNFHVLSETANSSIEKFLQLLDVHVSEAATGQVSRIVLEFLQKSGYLEWAIKHAQESPEVIPNLSAFVQYVREYERSNPEGTLLSFLEFLSLVKASGESPAQATLDNDYDAVKIQTVHGAKGLEFPIVFVLGATADKYPVRDRSSTLEIPDYFSSQKDVDERDAHAMEERRLFYVAMTRAKEFLFITSSELSSTGKSRKKPSPFIKEAGLEIASGNKVPVVQQLKLPIVSAKKIDKTDIPVSVPDHTSVSQIETYEMCPLKYKFQYVYRVPVPQSHILTFGTTIHAVLKEIAKQVSFGKKQTVENALDYYEKFWSGEGFNGKEHERIQRERGREILSLYLSKKPYLLNTSPIYAEESFRLKLNNITINGRIDRVDKIEGLVTVIDFKTGKVKDQKNANKDLQLSVYAIALKKVFGLKAERLVLSYVEEGVDRRTTRDDVALNSAQKRVMNAMENIQKLNFEPKPGFQTCPFCPFKDICDFSME